jgi:hypothetical protein
LPFIRFRRKSRNSDLMKNCGLLVGAMLLAACGKQSAPEAKQAAPASKPVQIQQFYSSATQVARGEEVLVCYGVENAAKVRLEPPIEEISPSMARCISYAPKVTSEIRLVATGADGSETSKSLQIAVAGVAPTPSSGMIASFMSSAKSVAPGAEVTLCYSTRNAASVSIQPTSRPGPIPLKGCVTERVNQKTEFTLTAHGAGGKQDHATVAVGVSQ